MASADAIIDRRRLRRKLTFWRVLALVIAAVAVLGFAVYVSGWSGVSAPHIAKIRVEGTILEDEDLLKRIGKVAESDAVRGVILTIDSPGGTTVGGEAIFEATRRLAEKKPVVAQVGTLAASAGYMIASATDHIVARQSSIVGSIGVLFQYPDLSEMLNKLGVKVETIKSSPLKAEPNFFSPATEEAKAMIRRMILDSYDWFVDLVEQRRPLDRAQVLALADGSVFTGRQALENKLVDALGGEEKAIEWLETKGVNPDLPVIEWKPGGSSTTSLLFSRHALNVIADWFGIPREHANLIGEVVNERIFLDGLVSVWHVDGGAAGVQ